MPNSLPTFANPVTWDSATSYDPLTIVIYQGASYTSLKSVPAGTLLTNYEYWCPTGNVYKFFKSITDTLALALTGKQDTLTAGNGISISNNTVSNSGVRSITTGDNNGTIKVNTGGTSTNVSVKGLGSASYTASSDYAPANRVITWKTLTRQNISQNAGHNYWNVGTVPVASGYTRIPVDIHTNNQNVEITKWEWRDTTSFNVYTRNTSNTSQTFDISMTVIYLNDSDKRS